MEVLAETAAAALQRCPDLLRRAEQALPVPEWAIERVLLSPDLLQCIFSSLTREGFGAAAVCATWAAAWDAKLKAEQWLRPDEACDRSIALMLKRIFMRNDALSGHDHDVFFDGPCPVFRLSSFGQGLCVAEASRASLVPSLQLVFDEQQSFASVSQSSMMTFGGRGTFTAGVRSDSHVTAGPHLHLKQLDLDGVDTRNWWPILASIEENAAYYLSRQSFLSLTLAFVELRGPRATVRVPLWPGKVRSTKLLFDQPRLPVGMALCGNCLAIGFNPCFDEDDEETIFAGPCVNVYDSSTFELLNSFEPFTSLEGYKLKALASHSGSIYVGADRQEHRTRTLCGIVHVLSLQGRLIRQYSFQGSLIDISISHGRLYSLSEIPAGVELSVHDLSSTAKLDSYPRTRLSWFPRAIYYRVEDHVVGATTQAHLRLACTATHVIVYFGGELNDGNVADPGERAEATVRTFRVLGTELVPLSQLQEEGGETAAAEEADGELFQRLVDAVPSASSLADLRALHVLLAEYPGDLDQRDDGGCTLLLRAIESSRGAVAQLLLEYGACPEEPDANGRTPLHAAAQASDAPPPALSYTLGTSLALMIRHAPPPPGRRRCASAAAAGVRRGPLRPRRRLARDGGGRSCCGPRPARPPVRRWRGKRPCEQRRLDQRRVVQRIVHRIVKR